MIANREEDDVQPAAATDAGKGNAPAAAPAVQRVSSQDLLGQAGELVIVHGGREYRLRLTQHGRLILTA